MDNRKRLLLIDGSSIVFRSFFALSRHIDHFKSIVGLHTNAVYGFHIMLGHLLERIHPTHVLVAFDKSKTTFRTEMYANYKGQRDAMPSELREQFPLINQMLDYLGIAHYSLLNYEADDIIGTVSKMAEQEEDYDTIIVSGDKDLIQLADENTVVEISKKGVSEFESFTPSYLIKKMGITPLQLVDLKALMGDRSDNIPGVSKIGEKLALKLVLEYGSLENLYKQIGSLKVSKMKENLIRDKENAFLSKALATIDTKVPISIGLEDLSYQTLTDFSKLARFYSDMGFKRLKTQLNIIQPNPETEEQSIAFEEVTEVTETMLSKDDFFHFEILGENYHTEKIIGFAWGNSKNIYVSKNLDLLLNPLFRKFLETTPLKVYDFKRSKVLLHHLGVLLSSAKFDSRLAKYLLSTTEDNQIATIASLFGRTSVAFDETVYGKGIKASVPKNFLFFSHLAKKVAVLVETEEPMVKCLRQNNQLTLLNEVELPLANVLAKMEIRGIRVRQDTLKGMQEENEALLSCLTREIYDLAGGEFNINSPKQLGRFLFEKLKLPIAVTKKTKTGYSTAVDVLEKLAPISPVVAKVLEYRQVSKIQSTYVVGLQESISPDSKIHTRYVQDLTRTGRLSSVDPNLQNIPIRLEQGRLIRRAFIPEWEDSWLLSSDYSQIELRILAHISQDENLIAAFRKGEDIHTATAMRVFGIKNSADVTKNDRRNAKAVNFGMVYGISDFGLSNNLRVSRKKAKSYIDMYFDRYPGIKKYMEMVVQEARNKGYVETLFKRRREVPDISSPNFNARSFAERTAINSPIQGSAADILKLAMIKLDKVLVSSGYQSKILLQVHDEIVLEVPDRELIPVKRLVKEVMETATEISVPLFVDQKSGRTWYDVGIEDV